MAQPPPFTLSFMVLNASSVHSLIRGLLLGEPADLKREGGEEGHER